MGEGRSGVAELQRPLETSSDTRGPGLQTRRIAAREGSDPPDGANADDSVRREGGHRSQTTGFEQESACRSRSHRRCGEHPDRSGWTSDKPVHACCCSFASSGAETPPAPVLQELRATLLIHPRRDANPVRAVPGISVMFGERARRESRQRCLTHLKVGTPTRINLRSSVGGTDCSGRPTLLLWGRLPKRRSPRLRPKRDRRERGSLSSSSP